MLPCKKKRSAFVNRCGPILLHNNVLPRVAKLTQPEAHTLGIRDFTHPLYFRELSPTDYFFKHLSAFLK